MCATFSYTKVREKPIVHIPCVLIVFPCLRLTLLQFSVRLNPIHVFWLNWTNPTCGTGKEKLLWYWCSAELLKLSENFPCCHTDNQTACSANNTERKFSSFSYPPFKPYSKQKYAMPSHMLTATHIFSHL